jgi:hypothetical protein
MMAWRSRADGLGQAPLPISEWMSTFWGASARRWSMYHDPGGNNRYTQIPNGTHSEQQSDVHDGFVNDQLELALPSF